MGLFSETFLQSASTSVITSVSVAGMAGSPFAGAYEFAKNQLVGPSRNVDQLSDVELLCSGGFAGICYWLFTYPTDIVCATLPAQQSPLTMKP